MPNFNTPENKGDIWNLMFEGGVFQGIGDSQVKNVKRDFDAKVNDISARNPGSENLTALNKAVITEMMNDVKKYKTPRAFAGDENPARGTASVGARMFQEQTKEPVAAREISDERLKLFQKGLETRQNDFSDMMKKDTPDTIDFSDINDKPIGAEMDNMMASVIAARENQLNVVLDTQDSKDANKWINNDSTKSSQHIKIGDDAKLDTSSIVEVAPKHVTFSQDEPSVGVTGFLNKLKKKPDDYTALHEKLDRILIGQDEVLSLLRKSERRNAETMDSYQRPTYTLQEPDDGRPTYASQGSDDGRREYNDDRNWNGGHLTPGS